MTATATIEAPVVAEPVYVKKIVPAEDVRAGDVWNEEKGHTILAVTEQVIERRGEQVTEIVIDMDWGVATLTKGAGHVLTYTVRAE